MLRAFCTTICAMTLFLTGCLPSIHNLHVQDRIPHEQEKGYVQFISTIEKNKIQFIPYVFRYDISKKQYNHTIPIHSGPVQVQSPPISDQIGKQTYLIQYPIRVLSNTLEEYDSKAARQATEGLMPLFIGKVWNKVLWIDEKKVTEDDLKLKFEQDAVVVYRTKQVEVSIEPDKITRVNIVYQISGEVPKSVSFEGSEFQGEIVSLTAETPRPVENVVKIAGPVNAYKTVFDADYHIVFLKVLDAAQKLDWEILYKNETEGKVIVKKKRISGEDLIFSVGVYPDSFGKTHVDISSDSFWQRWGSINTELSRKHIDEFYACLNGFLKSH